MKIARSCATILNLRKEPESEEEEAQRREQEVNNIIAEEAKLNELVQEMILM